MDVFEPGLFCSWFYFVWPGSSFKLTAMTKDEIISVLEFVALTGTNIQLLKNREEAADGYLQMLKGGNKTEDKKTLHLIKDVCPVCGFISSLCICGFAR